MPGLSITIKATDWRGALAALDRNTRLATAVAMYEEEQFIMDHLSKPQVPVMSGALRDSGEANPPVWEGDILNGSMSYGNDDVDYAMYVHEDLLANHPNGGKAKFLEDPIREEGTSGRTANRLADRIRMAIT